MRRRRYVTLLVVALIVGLIQIATATTPASGKDRPYVPKPQKYEPVPHRSLDTTWKRPKSVKNAKTGDNMKDRGPLPRKWTVVQTAVPSKPDTFERLPENGGWTGDPLATLTTADDGAGGGNGSAGTGSGKVKGSGKGSDELEGRYRIGLIDPAIAEQLGTPGLVFEVVAEPGADLKAGFELDYNDLAKLRGYDWATRLQLATLPACALTTPNKPACQALTPLADSTNDPTQDQVTATLEPLATGDVTTGSPTDGSTGETDTPSGEESGTSSDDASEEATDSVTGSPEDTEAQGDKADGKSDSSKSDDPKTDPKQDGSRSGESTARTGAASGATLVAAVAGPGGSQGSYTASSLQSSGSWSHGGSSGSFSWNYPVTVTPPASGEVAPGVGLSYDSASVDGINSNANPQSSWVGLGFDYQPGYIERTFRNCKEATPSSTDQGLCWAGDILTMHLPGGSTQALVVDGTTIRPEHDNGEKIERLTGSGNGSVDGEYWRVTTTDGTRYTFGAHLLPGGTSTNATKSAWNVTVKGGTATDGCASKRCVRTWRWNLAMVEDIHNNVAAYYYAKETSYFVPSGTTTRTAYDRAGYLTRIDYGIKNVSNNIYSVTNPPNRVTFTVAERCKPANGITCTDAQFVAANQANWPDVPIDQNCTSTTTTACNIHWPTFWTRKRLTTVTASYYSGTAYVTADSYALAHEWSQLSSTYMLDLHSITRTATAAGQTLTLPPVTFGYEALDSRVKGYKSLPDMGYDRLRGITTETGATISVLYSSEEKTDVGQYATLCTLNTIPADPADNSTECYPVNWTPPFTSDPTLDYFHKYAVMTVVEGDAGTLRPSRHTNYKYSNPGWHYDDNEVVKPAQRTYGQWRGYQTVETSTGNTNWLSENGTNDQVTRSVTTYYRGMKIDFHDSRNLSRDDLEEFSGMAAETRTFNGATELASTRSIPASLAKTATRVRGTGLVDLKAYVVATEKTTVTTNGTDSGTTDLEKVTTTDYRSPTGEPFIKRPNSVQVEATGGTGSAAKTCTVTTYADNTTNWVRSVPATVTTYSNPTADPNGGCKGTDIVAGTRTYYDLKTAVGGSNITNGDPTKVETAADLKTDGTPRYTTSTATFDTSGRLKSTTAYPDGIGTPATARLTQIAYTTNAGGLLTGVTTTLPAIAGLSATTTTQTLNAPRGTVYKSTDAAGRITSATIDALGRYTAVWYPGRDQATQTASITYAYQLATDLPLAVTTKTLVDPGNGATAGYDTTIQILDSLGTLRQTQTTGATGGRVITDNYVDSHGWVVATDGPWYATGAPSTTSVAATSQSSIDNRTTTLYDQAGRPTKVQSWRGVETAPTRTTTTVYGGDRTTVIPPKGAVATTSLLNGLGQTTELRRYTEPVTPSTFATAATNRTTYGYAPSGQVNKMTTAAGIDGKEATWNYTYDLIGRQIESDDPDSGTSTTKHDDTDAITAVTDAANRTVSTTYDAWARPTARYTENGDTAPGTKMKVADWTYDTLAKGELTSSRSHVIDDATGDIRIYTNTVAGYTNAGLPTGVDLTLDVPGFLPKYSTRTTYTATGLPSSNTLASTRDTTLNQGNSAEQLFHFYTSLGLERGLTGTNAYVSDTLYTPFREASQYVLGVNDATSALTYTRDPHTRRITNTLMSGQIAPPQVENVATTYDATGNVTRTVDTRGPAGSPTQTTCYRYDSLQQLSDAWTASDNCAADPSDAVIGGPDPFWQSWEHDEAGSRIMQTIHALPGEAGDDAVTTYANGTDGHAHALASTETAGATDPATIGVRTNLPATSSAEYTTAGATKKLTTPAGDTTYSYRDDGSIRTIAAPDGATSEFVNGPDGSRLLRIDRKNGTTNTTLYLPGQQIRLTDTGTTRTLTTNRYYTLASGQQIAVRKNDDNPLFTLADPHGTTQVSFDPYSNTTNPPISRRAFDPYGNELSNDADATPWVDDRTFVNKPLQPTTGLVDLGARQYDPSVGRFTSVDPILNPADPTQANGYNYANNNPITYTDPDGLASVCIREGTCEYVPNPAGGAPIVTGPEQPRSSAAGIASNGGGDRQAVRDYLINYSTGMTISEKSAAEPSAPHKSTKGVLLALGLAGCSWVPLLGLGCDAYDLKKTVSEDGLFSWGTGASLIGFAPLGDFVKVPKQVDNVADAARAAENLGDTAKGLCSFSGATVVLMADGTKKPIAEVRIGDEVIATDPETGEQAAKLVDHVFVHHDTVVDLAIGHELITTTEDHPFWSVTDHRFERADELGTDEKVLRADGRTATVSWPLSSSAREALAYNLSVEETHTFHVGEGEILVHNNDTCIPWSSGSLRNVAGDLAAGARTASVANRAQAEELFLRVYQGKGYTNTTGMSGKQVRDFYGSKAGTYHWDTELTPGLTHSTGPHLQIHQPDGVIVRIFYGGTP